LEIHKITHVLAIHDNPKHLYPNLHYLCVQAADNVDQDLTQYFPVCNDFIHGARLRKDCNVLIHCLAGMSRSVTIAIAYIMSVSDLHWRDALRVVRVGRRIANPNAGFQLQLQDFENNKVDEERRRMKERFPSLALRQSDLEYMYRALEHFDTMIASRDLCHYNCKRNENCPTGEKSLFRSNNNDFVL
jgi:atypical dual specificity phosphatase